MATAPDWAAEADFLLGLSDKDLGLRLYALWAVAQAEKLGISEDQISAEIAEDLRLRALRLDTDSEDLAGLEKALHLCAKGDSTRGGRMFRKHLHRQAMGIATLDEAKTGRRRQRALAQKPRTDALQAVILDVVRRKPAIQCNELIAQLRLQEHRGVIEAINEAEACIEWTDKKRRAKSTALSALPARLSRARKILRSR
jgi:hypothetical protein